ncbi:MAG TPA: hypothetical protein VFN03_02605 [Trueperaceae bacterium]|nr:hypothetical protein [Trueperaceae bacterium]
MLSAADRYIYAGRLLNYLDKPDKAVAMFTEGLASSPDEPRLLRHRGHRYITVRRYRDAVTDLKRAAALVAGQPDEHEFFQPETQADIINLILGREDLIKPQHLPVNAETIEQTKGAYKSTLHGSIYYHLAIAHYLLGEFEEALEAFRAGDETSVDDDMRVANADWIYMTLRRLGREADAAAHIAPFDTAGASVNPEEDFYLQRLKMYKGEQAPERLLELSEENKLGFTTQGYGVGNWYLYNGDEARATQIFEKVVSKGAKNGFAYMAAEADLARLTTGQ